MGAGFCFLPCIFMSTTYTDKNKPCFRWANRHSQFWYFSHPSSDGTSWKSLSHNNPANGRPYKFRSRGTAGSSMFAQELGRSCRGRRITTSGHSDSGILSNLGARSNFTWVYEDTTSAVCPSQSGNLAITFITFAAVVGDADEPSSVKNFVGSRVVFYSVTTEHDSFIVFFVVLVLTPRFITFVIVLMNMTRCAFLGTLEPTRMSWMSVQV